MSLDKYQMFLWLNKNGYNCAKSYMDKEEFYKDIDNKTITYPVFDETGERKRKYCYFKSL